MTDTLARAIRLVWLSDRRLALWHTLLSVLQALLPLAALYALKQVIDLATRIFTATDVPRSLTVLFSRCLEETDYRLLALWTVTGAICLVLTLAGRLIINWMAEFHAIAVTDYVYNLLHHTMLRVDYSFFENPDDQNRLYLAREEALTRPTRLLSGLGQLLQALVGLSGALLIMATFSLWLPLLLSLAALPALLFRLHRARRFHIWRKTLIPLERQAGYFHAIMTDNAGAKDIRLYGHGAFCRARFAVARERLREERIAWRRFVLSREALGIMAGLAISGLTLLWLGMHLLAGAITLGSVVFCIQAVQRGQSALTALHNAVALLFEDAIFLQSFEELLQQPATIAVPANPLPLPQTIKEGVTFENVSFTYPGSDKPVLQNLSFVLLPGERVALSGRNGTGKSTLVKLLCRLYDPSSGRITLDGIDIRRFDPTAWRSAIGALFQDFNTYQMSLRDNIHIGHSAIPPDAPEVTAAAHNAGVTPLLEQWPQGLDTLLGRWLHNGIEPSIGQWQRIAIARAFLRPGLLIVLDEPASALDATSMHEMFETLKRLGQGRITLFTSHRDLPPGLADKTIEL